MLVNNYLSKKATETFNKIIDTIDDSGYIKIENSESFMPLSVEKIFTVKEGILYSLCHYFEQNGDLCQDPEMTFLRTNDGKVTPMSFQQAIPPIYEESLFWDESGALKMRPRMHKDHTVFANQWILNIKYQQRL